MDKKQSSATGTSASGKQGEKKEENFLTKTAHSIRDKVHEFADDVKEKTHLKKKDKDHKKKDKSQHPGSDSDDVDDSAKPTHPSPAASGPKKDTGRDADKPNTGRDVGKPNTAESKPAASSTTEKKDPPAPTRSQPSSDKPPSNDSAKKPSNDHKDAAAAHPSPPSSKPPSDNSAAKSYNAPANNDSKPSMDKPKNTADGGDHKDKVHISFDGVSTVDDLLDRIDEAVERSKLVVDGGKGNIGLSIDSTSHPPKAIPADLEKKPLNKAENDPNKSENKDEPIRLNYNDIHKIADVLLKIDREPGNRKVVLENAPENTGSGNSQEQTNTYPTAAPTTPTGSVETDDSSGPPKSILKTSQNPSSLATSTRTSSIQDDQIHVNIEGIHNVDDLLDRLDDAVQNAPVVIDTKPSGEKRKAPQPPNQNNDKNQDNDKHQEASNQNNDKNQEAQNQNDDKNQEASKASIPNQKREAPKAPSSTNDESNKDKPSEQKDKPSQGDGKVASFKIPEHEFEDNADNKEPPPSSTNEKKNDDAEEKKTDQSEKKKDAGEEKTDQGDKKKNEGEKTNWM